MKALYLQVWCVLHCIIPGIGQPAISSISEAEFRLTLATDRNLLHDSTQTTLQEVMIWATREGHPNVEADAHYLLGKRHLLLMQEAEGLAHFRQAATLYAKVDNPARQGFALERIGLVYLQKNLLDSAFLSFQKAISLYSKHDLVQHLWTPYLGLANVYKKQGNKAQAIQYARMAVEVVETSNDRTSKVLVLNTMVQFAYEYDSLALYARYSEEYLKLYTPLEIDQNILQHIGHFAMIKDPMVRIDTIRKAITRLTTIPVTLELISSYYQLGAAYAEAKDWQNAILSWSAGYDIEQKNLSTVHFRPAFAMALSSAYRAMGDYPKALEYYTRYATMKDSILQLQTQSRIAELQVQYETHAKDDEIKDQRIALTRRTMQRNGVIVLLLVILAGGAYVIYTQRRHLSDQKTIVKQREILHQNELKALRHEHAVATLQTLITAQEEERRRIAQDLHDSLGSSLATLRMQLQRCIRIKDTDDVQTENPFSVLDNIISEVRRISHNMMPQALIRMGLPTALEDLAATIQLSGHVQVSFQNIDFEEPLSQNREITLYRIAQELCSNAIKHADAQHLLIQLSRHNGSATLVIEDDGKGITHDAENGSGIGLHNVRSRVAYLQGELEIFSQPGEGTSITVQIPVS